MERVMVGMSGGVDSSVAALLLAQQGYAVTGVTLRLHADAGQDIEDARRVCEGIGIEHRVLDLSETFRCHVVEEFVSEYLAGRTPNPCVTCNRTIKFGAMLDYALRSGMDCLATGHYIRVAYNAARGRYTLARSAAEKDQSYVLYSLTQEQLARVRFPLGELDKAQVRALAREYALPVADKGDSMEVCFIPDDDHAAFIERYTGRRMQPGDFVDEEGRVLGRHQGIGRYTIGQRKGLGIALGQPMFVVALDAERDRVVLGPQGRQMADGLQAGRLNFVSIAPPDAPLRVQARIRYQAPPAAATRYPAENGVARVVFDQPQKSITPGQAVVFYDGDEVLGGGCILRSMRTEGTTC